MIRHVFPALHVRRKRLVLLLFCCFLLATVILLPPSSSFQIGRPGSGLGVASLSNLSVIISLASSHTRLDTELPIAVYSLKKQTVAPKEIRIYFPESEKDVILRRARLTLLDSTNQPGADMGQQIGKDMPLSEHLLHPAVKLLFTEDVGPATKFVPVIHELLSKVDAGELDKLDQPVIIVGELNRNQMSNNGLNK
jgi:hypothetical protein